MIQLLASPTVRKFAGYFVIALGVLFVLWAIVVVVRGWIADGKTQAVVVHQAETDALVSNAAIAAERKASADKRYDELIIERDRAEQSEAINASMRDPGGDPLGAALDRMR